MKQKKTFGNMFFGTLGLFILLLGSLGVLGFATNTEWHTGGFIILCLMFVSGGYMAWKNFNPFATDKAQAKQDEEEQIRDILRLARQEQGRLTALGVATDCHLSVERSQALLEDLTTKGVAMMSVQDEGYIVFEFPDFLTVSSKKSISSPHHDGR